MMGLPAKWWFLGGALLLTIWLVWQAPPEVDNSELVVAAVQPVVKFTEDKSAINETLNHQQTLINRASSDMVSNLFRTPPEHVTEPLAKSEDLTEPVNNMLPALPFRYIGRIEKGQSVTIFVMEGNALHLLQAGDSPRADYKLEAIDLADGELRWRYLPAQKIRKMSIQP